jgi:hypothetical protein
MHSNAALQIVHPTPGRDLATAEAAAAFLRALAVSLDSERLAGTAAKPLYRYGHLRRRALVRAIHACVNRRIVGQPLPRRVRPRQTAGVRAYGCRSTTGGRNLDTADEPSCPWCSAGTANVWRSSWCFGTRRSGRRCTGGTAAMRDGPDRRLGQSATRFTVRSGSTPALTNSS